MMYEIEMSMIGELDFFLEIQIKQGNENTSISQSKYTKDFFKRLDLENTLTYPMPMSTLETR